MVWVQLGVTFIISRTVAVALSVGLRARLAALLAGAVNGSGADVTIAPDDEETDTASFLKIMTPGVGHRDEVTLSTDDDNAGAVPGSLVELLSWDLDKE